MSFLCSVRPEGIEIVQKPHTDLNNLEILNNVEHSTVPLTEFCPGK